VRGPVRHRQRCDFNRMRWPAEDGMWEAQPRQRQHAAARLPPPQQEATWTRPALDTGPSRGMCRSNDDTPIKQASVLSCFNTNSVIFLYQTCG
jgi:hypothetical protein